MGFLAIPASSLAPHLDEITLPHGVVRDVASDLHLTVAFFGQGVPLHVERAALAALDLSTLTAPSLASSSLASTQVVLTHGLALGHRGRALALAGETHSDVAHALGVLRDSALALVGRDPEARLFLPHVTIARVPKDAPEHLREEAARRIVDVRCALTLPLARLALFSWRDAHMSSGPRYVIDSERALG